MSATPDKPGVTEFATQEQLDTVVTMSYQHFAEHGQHLVRHGYPYHGNSYQTVKGRDLLTTLPYLSNWDEGCITLSVPEYSERDDPRSGCLLEASLEINFTKFDGLSVVRSMFFNTVRGKGGGIIFDEQVATSARQSAEKPPADPTLSPAKRQPSSNAEYAAEIDDFGAPVPTILLAAMYTLIVKAIYV